MEKANQRFEALSRICLNNWHYIDKKILSFHEGINFFTGHSGSGKSTVIDAIQILLYADSDGRGFFNKAAADDSDRTLIEYLRGMVNIGEDNKYSYLRNRNFSTTIVMELRQTDTGGCQSVGVAFDVEASANTVGSRLFFWHQGPLLESGYRTGGRAMATGELKEYLQQNLEQGSYYFGSSNERFRRQLYDIYLGGLNEERFPRLFRRAIPFRMKMKLEEFVKEYICVEEDIQIEEMQESVMQYGRMRRKIGDTCREIEELEQIGAAFAAVMDKEREQQEYGYFKASADIRRQREQAAELQDRIGQYENDHKLQGIRKTETEAEIAGLEARIRELVRRIAASGYEDLIKQLDGADELIERFGSSKGKWNQTLRRLKAWEGTEAAPKKVLWDIKRFEACDIKEEELARLKESIRELHEDTELLRRGTDSDIRQLEKQSEQCAGDLEKLKRGGRAYPRELEEARSIIAGELSRQAGREVPVEVLADLLEVPDDTWRNAVEGYMGNNKLQLIVEPEYAGPAMGIYEGLDPKAYHSVSVLDTEKVTSRAHKAQKGALSEEVLCSRPYVRAYLDHLMGNVIKCGDISGLREQGIGITSGCELYQGYKLQHINPNNYHKHAYIGNEGRTRRIRQLEKEMESAGEAMIPLREQREAYDTILSLEALAYPVEEYMGWQQDMYELPARKQEQRILKEKLEVLKGQNIDSWKQEQEDLEKDCAGKKEIRDVLLKSAAEKEKLLRESRDRYLEINESLLAAEQKFVPAEALEQRLEDFFIQKKQRGSVKLESFCTQFTGKELHAGEEAEHLRTVLRELRFQYLRMHPNRSFSAEGRDNKEYDELLKRLQYTDLELFYQKADEQAKDAVELFKQDFVFKIRSAIREAMERKEELNRIIDNLDFGKDRYRFKFMKNRGADGKYYDMFMAEDLKINPASLRDSMDNQMNMFTMGHENQYGDMIHELIGIFIPPDNASAEELEEAKRNMEKYADYRTYLSFEMEQIIEGENTDTMMIPLSKMIKKNSGGEGQNPLYVALLASFAQAYRINLSSNLERSPTLRLVVLDEAFSKMDAEKVGSCIKLIRGFGFQAIISATNDKIQNYLESVDKTFVFANPNKKHISIQEFEKKEFRELTAAEEDETEE